VREKKSLKRKTTVGKGSRTLKFKRFQCDSGGKLKSLMVNRQWTLRKFYKRDRGRRGYNYRTAIKERAFMVGLLTIKRTLCQNEKGLKGRV